MQKTKLIFNQVIAHQLKDQGYKLLTTLQNKNNPKMDVFVFELSDELLINLEILIKK